jgi:hypothetical protein
MAHDAGTRIFKTVRAVEVEVARVEVRVGVNVIAPPTLFRCSPTWLVARSRASWQPAYTSRSFARHLTLWRNALRQRSNGRLPGVIITVECAAKVRPG